MTDQLRRRGLGSVRPGREAMLHDKVAALIGAARGIGRAIAVAMDRLQDGLGLRQNAVAADD